jgi:hypothetical protein
MLDVLEVLCRQFESVLAALSKDEEMDKASTTLLGRIEKGVAVLESVEVGPLVLAKKRASLRAEPCDVKQSFNEHGAPQE